jgi:hypothetical protein
VKFEDQIKLIKLYQFQQGYESTKVSPSVLKRKKLGVANILLDQFFYVILFVESGRHKE